MLTEASRRGKARDSSYIKLRVSRFRKGDQLEALTSDDNDVEGRGCSGHRCNSEVRGVGYGKRWRNLIWIVEHSPCVGRCGGRLG